MLLLLVFLVHLVILPALASQVVYGSSSGQPNSSIYSTAQMIPGFSTVPQSLDLIPEEMDSTSAQFLSLINKDAREAEIQGVIAEVPEIILKCVSRDEAALAWHRRTSPSEFIVPFDQYMESIKANHYIGMRFKMIFEGEEVEHSFTGTIVGIEDVDPVRWIGSKWRCLKVVFSKIPLIL
ncbi:hypothetical protein MRB53_010395 [Persea americana]|uniref:Uncharacterized protein n=1 Tax=Persea americana TaxID=3435 RepID=A0ACC2LS18_PERAE|nr:hypothetical protein MRB53_010395 [Persea americana]